MIVDNITENLELLGGMLRKLGCRVSALSRGDLALRGAAESPPDLILLDIDSPGMDGYKICKRLKADKQLCDIPVIFTCTLSESMDRVKGFAVGGVDYIYKPYRFVEVEVRVKAHLEIRRLQVTAQDNYSRLKELEIVRDNLVYMIADDLLAPIQCLMGYVELMQIKKQKFNMVNWVHLARIGDIAQTSMDMVMNFLDITRLKNGEMELHKTSKDIGEIVRSAVSSISCLSDNRDFVVELPNRPVGLNCDEKVIHRVITNLLVNTFKFTGKDKQVRLVVFVKKDRVRVEVHHASPGIPKKFHKKIFEKFGMAEIYKNGDSYFTGLGLTFCKLALGAHGGEIGVDSENGRDNMFWFSLPCLPLREKEENFEKQTFTTTYPG